MYTVLDGFFQNTFLLQDGDLQGEARAAFESARAELMALENGTREPTQTAWESARQTAEAWMKVMPWHLEMLCIFTYFMIFECFSSFQSLGM